MFLCSYETVKYVHIQDARLGILRWIMLVGILLYVVVVEMAQLGGYLEAFPVVGVVRFSLQQPTVDNCDPSDAQCTNAFAPLEELSYCRQHQHQQQSYKSKFEYNGTVYPCQIYEAVNAQVVRETSLVVWTRAISYNQTLICDGDGIQPQPQPQQDGTSTTTCPRTYQTEDETSTSTSTQTQTQTRTDPDISPFYVAQAEAFTVLVEHAVTASQICQQYRQVSKLKHTSATSHYSCSAQALDYPGRLFSTNGHLCRSEYQKNNSYTGPHKGNHVLQAAAPCYIGANHTAKAQDFFSLDVLLQAAGVSSLDDCSDEGYKPSSFAGSSCQQTYRETGATLLLQIVWNDFGPFHGLIEPFYYYAPQLISHSYKESLPFYHGYYRSSRVLLRAHGIKVAVLISGNFHQFQVLNFLTTLTTALGLLAVATTVVDSLMLYVLPEKERYQNVKYETVEGAGRPLSEYMHRRLIWQQTPQQEQQREEPFETLEEVWTTTRGEGEGEGEQVAESASASLLHEPLLQGARSEDTII